MRVGIDALPLVEPRTGVGHYTFELAWALARIAPAVDFQLVSEFPLAPDVVEALQNGGPTNLRAVRPRRLRRWWTIGLPRYIRQAELNIFHGTNYDVPLWNRKRTVVTVHDLSVFVHPDTHDRHIARRARRRLPIMLRAAARVITPTEAVKREIVERFKIDPNTIVVTPEAPRKTFTPVPFERTAETRRRLGIDDDFILFVGTIEPRKNLLTLMRAFAEILRETPHRPQLVVAGGQGWLMDELDRFLVQANFGDRLRMIGYVGDDDLRALYSACKLFVYPSLYEGFCLPPLEAMACGAPVVASRIDALVETLGANARLVPATDERALAKAIIELLEDEGERRRFSAAGLRHAAQFSWEETARLTLAVYEELLRANSPVPGEIRG